MTGEYQNELFKEYKKKKGKLQQFAKKIIPSHRHFTVVMPLENVVLVGIIVILGLIMSFALGVEKGKHQTPRKEAVLQERPAEPPKIKEADLPEKKTEARPAEVAEKPKKTKDVTGRRAPYTIQLISFKSKPLAEKQTALLKKKGYESFVIPRGAWHQVCVGKYNDKGTASKELAIFEKEFKGCFIRRK